MINRIELEDLTPKTYFADAYQLYREAGWEGTLPISNYAKTKSVLVSGYHGGKKNPDKYPSEDQCDRWACNSYFANTGVAIRLPRIVVAIDIDDYEKKNGAAELAARESVWGPLPPTVSNTARGEDQPSRQLLFIVPVGLEWPGNVPGCPSIEVVHHGNRYIAAWPTYHHTGNQYVWYGPDGKPLGRIPTIEDIAELPEKWVTGITGGEAEKERPYNAAAPSYDEWVDSVPSGPMCREMANQLERSLKGIEDNLHGTVRDATAALVHLGNEGHAGLDDAIDVVRDRFFDIAADRTNRVGNTAEDEWVSMLDGAVRLIKPEHTSPKCWCHIDFKPKADEPLPEFPVEALPPVMKDIVEASAANLRSRTDIPAQFSLGAISGAVQGRLDVLVTGWSPRPALVWPFTLAGPGSNKSPARRHIMGPFDRVESVIREKERAKVIAYEMEVEGLRKQIQKKEAKGEFDIQLQGMKLRLSTLEDNPVALTQLKTDDTTPEALARRLNAQGGRMVIDSAEGNVLVSALGLRYGQGGTANVTALVQAYDKETSRVDRVDESKSFTLTNPALTISVAMQPDIVQKGGAFTDARVVASGFLVRANWCVLEEDEIVGAGNSRPKPIDTSVAKAWDAFLADTTVRFRQLNTPVELYLSEEAEDLFWDRYEVCYAKARSKDEKDLEKQYWSKFMDKVGRLAGLLHVATVGADTVINEGAREIPPTAVRAALAICDYSFAHFRRIFDLDGFDPREEDLTKLMKGVKNYLVKQDIKTGEVRLSKKTLSNSRAWKYGKFAELKPALDLAAELNLMKFEYLDEGRIAFTIRADDVYAYFAEED